MTGNDSAGRKRILLVDDEEALAWSLASRLSKVRPQFSVETANDGETALAKIHRAPVDLLVADVRMPGMSGIELVLAARNTYPSLPVIVMTAFKGAEVSRITSGSFTDFLEKPFQFEVFLGLVDQALARTKVGFSGAISVQTLPDIVQLYVLSNATGMLSVRHRADEGRIWFEQGTIPHATTANGSGEEAFFEVMTWSGGEFSMRLGAQPPERSIVSNWQELLMESCRREDEGQRPSYRRPSASSSGWTQAPPPPPSSKTQDDAAEDDLFANLTIDIDMESAEATTALRANHQPVFKSAIPEDLMNVKDSLSKLNSIDGFVGAALVDSESGMLLGQEGGGGLNLEVAAAGNTEVVKAKRKTMANLGFKDGIEDILITLGKQYHIIRPLRSRPGVFFYLALERSRANLAMARLGLADVEKELVV